MEDHIKLLQIDMEYRKLFRKKQELESKENLTESEENILETINEQINEKLETIGYNLDDLL